MEPWQLAAEFGLAAGPAGGMAAPAAPGEEGPLKVPGVGIVPGSWSAPHSIEEGRARRRAELVARVRAAEAAAAQAGP